MVGVLFQNSGPEFTELRMKARRQGIPEKDILIVQSDVPTPKIRKRILESWTNRENISHP